HAASIQRHAPFHSRAGKSGRLSVGRSPGEPSTPSLRPKQVRPGQSRFARHYRHVWRSMAAVQAIELHDLRENVTTRHTGNVANLACQRRRSRYASPPVPGIRMSLAPLLYVPQIVPEMKATARWAAMDGLTD